MKAAAEPSAVPGDGRLPWRTKLTWALGSLGDNYAGNTISQLKDAVYTVALGVAPELVGWALSLPRLLDACFDPVVGHWSDRWKARGGRRRPFIFAGAVGLGVTMWLLWLPPAGGAWSEAALAGYLLVTSMLFYAAYSVFLVPYRALGLELTADYHERTRLQGWGMLVGLLGGLGLPWLYKLTLWAGGWLRVDGAPAAEVILAGARWVGGGVALLVMVTCLVPAWACREPRRSSAESGTVSLRASVRAALANGPFRLMLGMNFCAIVGMYAPVTVALLVSIHWLCPGDQAAAANLMGFLGMAQMLGSLAGVPGATALSVRWGKRGAALAAIGVGLVGFASQRWTLVPAHPYWALGSQFLIGWGMQGVWLMSATMNADVCDEDELATGRRREGVYGAVFALEQKIAFAVAALVGGYLATRSGFVPDRAPDAAVLRHLRTTLIATPLVGLTLAGVFIAAYPLSRTRVAAIQAALHARIVSRRPAG